MSSERRQSVVSVQIEGLHRRLNFSVDFHNRLNIIYGKNGSAKTTTLHVIANILHRDFSRFYHLDFDHIVLHFSDSQTVHLESIGSDDGREMFLQWNNEEKMPVPRSDGEEHSRRASPRLDEDSVIGRAGMTLDDELPYTYLPAFRNLLEAIDNRGSRDRALERHWRALEFSIDATIATSPRHSSDLQMRLARDLFGEFTPAFFYPHPRYIESAVSSQARNARIRIAERESEIFANSVRQILIALSNQFEQPSEIGPAEENLLLDEIERLLSQLDESSGAIPTLEVVSSKSVFDELTSFVAAARNRNIGATVQNILSVYRDSLEAKLNVQKQSLDRLVRLLQSVNQFLEGKEIGFAAESLRPKLLMDDGAEAEIRSLSSGERHILSIMYAISNLSAESGVVLIDEPELSLHIDWQRPLISRLANVMGDRQLIVTTHSPEIGANHIEHYLELEPTRPNSVARF